MPKRKKRHIKAVIKRRPRQSKQIAYGGRQHRETLEEMMRRVLTAAGHLGAHQIDFKKHLAEVKALMADYDSIYWRGSKPLQEALRREYEMLLGTGVDL